MWQIVNRPNVAKNGRTRWLFKRKLNVNGSIKYKARLVVRGFKDQNIYEPKETYAPVSKLPLVRAVIAIANKFDFEMCQFDVKTAFLNKVLAEEIYMEIPEGTSHSIIGLRVSPKSWNDRFTLEALKLGLENCYLEPCLFIRRNGSRLLILLLYVDDILMASNEKDKLREVQGKLSKTFEMAILGRPKEFLDISIRRDRKNKIIELNQEKYVDKILERFGFSHSHPKNTPMVTSQVANRERKLRETEANDEMLKGTQEPENVPYREAVGTLLYLAGATRPDISFAVNILSRHQVDPKKVTGPW